MIEVSIQVGSNDVCFQVAVQAESIRQALCIAGDRFAGSNLRVVFPIKPEAFFVKDVAATAEMIEIPASAAA
jgi:hypothetical protein